jgi:4-hydroxy-2-oxoheptanedioate aldolase
LNSSQKKIGSWSLYGNPLIAIEAANSSLDFLCLDFEHGHYAWDTAEITTQLLQSSGKMAVLRIGDTSPLSIQKAFDIGVDYLQISGIQSIADIESLRRKCLLSPLGTRGFSPWARNSTAKAKVETDIIPQVENVELLGSLLDGNANLLGINHLFLGRYDLSASSKVTGQLESDSQLKYAKTFAEFCISSGIRPWTVAHNPADATRMFEFGFEYVSLSSDRLAIASEFEKVGKVSMWT